MTGHPECKKPRGVPFTKTRQGGRGLEEKKISRFLSETLGASYS